VDDVRLPDLEVIRRYSIAVRREHAPADEVIDALRADLEWLTGGSQTGNSASADTPRRTSVRKTPKR
jgi:hypothetical protein